MRFVESFGPVPGSRIALDSRFAYQPPGMTSGEWTGLGSLAMFGMTGMSEGWVVHSNVINYVLSSWKFRWNYQRSRLNQLGE
jgi:hypothetical protein